MKSNKEKTLELIRACAKGDDDSLKTFFELYSKDIYNFPIKVFHLTEDDASDFFIYAFERLRSGKRFQTFQGKSSFKTWLYTVLRNMLIDWKRNKKELKLVSNVKVNSEGVEYSSIEDTPDGIVPLKQEATHFSEKFKKALSEIKIENRIIFKLAYIYYLNLEKDEIEYLLQKTNFNIFQLKEKIMEIRDQLSDKAFENIKNEEKITSIYTNILELQELNQKQTQLKFDDNLPFENKYEIAISKKLEQRRKLLEKKSKGLFLSRTPYKIISSILGIPEGGISISIQRVIAKIQKKIL